ILRIDKEKERLSLGYKQLISDPWVSEIPQRYHVGANASGKVSKVADFGVFVELEGGVEGLIHVSELGPDMQESLEDKFAVGQEIVAKIVKVDCEDRKIALSLWEHLKDLEQRKVEQFNSSQGTVDQSLGRVAQTSDEGKADDSESNG
ncbi:MAG: S1 RNA-binding domain-containing protein, partial [Nitrospirota bacterium]|nr:S1 RNA-binding domain-containing protein [Nitrospirota bacterium]